MYNFLHKNYISKPYDLDQDIPTNLVPWSFKLYQYQITISTSILFSKHYYTHGPSWLDTVGYGGSLKYKYKFLIWLDIIAYMKKGVPGGARGQMWTKYTDSHGLKAMMHIWSWHQQLIKSTSYFWMAKLWMLACIIALFHTVTNRKNTWKLHCNRSRKPLWHVSEIYV